MNILNMFLTTLDSLIEYFNKYAFCYGIYLCIHIYNIKFNNLYSLCIKYIYIYI